MSKPIPHYRIKFTEFRNLAWEAMSEADRAEYHADRIAQRDRSRARHLSRQNRMRLVHEMEISGSSSAEIAAALHISKQRLSALRRQWGLPPVGKSGFRRVAVWIKDDHAVAAGNIATEAGMSRDDFMQRVLAAILADTVAARRIAGLKRAA